MDHRTADTRFNVSPLLPSPRLQAAYVQPHRTRRAAATRSSCTQGKICLSIITGVFCSVQKVNECIQQMRDGRKERFTSGLVLSSNTKEKLVLIFLCINSFRMGENIGCIGGPRGGRGAQWLHDMKSSWRGGHARSFVLRLSRR